MAMESTHPQGAAHAFKLNRIAAIVMTLATAAALLLLRPDLSLVYLAYMGISVYPLSWAKTRGFFGQPRPVLQQNFAAYVSMSTIGFVATLLAAPHMIDQIGSGFFILFGLVIAVLVLRAIFVGK
jgi:hypothetical protein